MGEWTNADAAWARGAVATLLHRCCVAIASQFLLLADQVRK